MSSDDSICILKSPRSDGHGDEWRVKRIGSIHWDYSDTQDTKGSVDTLIIWMREEFKEAPVFRSKSLMEDFVDQLDEKLQESGMPEYGPTDLVLTHPLWVDPWNKSE